MFRQFGAAFQLNLVQSFGRFAGSQCGETVARRHVQETAVEEEIFPSQILNLRFERAVPRSWSIDRSVALNDEAFNISSKEFRRPAEITAERVERNVFRDQPELCIE